jgi:hypothetical protein
MHTLGEKSMNASLDDMKCLPHIHLNTGQFCERFARESEVFSSGDGGHATAIRLATGFWARKGSAGTHH